MMAVHKISVNNTVPVFQYQKRNECKNQAFRVAAISDSLQQWNLLNQEFEHILRNETLPSKRCICFVTN